MLVPYLETISMEEYQHSDEQTGEGEVGGAGSTAVVR
jgi:hypothetical protein